MFWENIVFTVLWYRISLGDNGINERYCNYDIMIKSNWIAAVPQRQGDYSH
jgi:hypothetical protein